MSDELNPHLAATLEVLGYDDSEGLLTVAGPSEPGSRDYYWRELRDKIGLDAVFFNDGVPLVGFSSEEEREGLHGIRKRLWNYGRVPLLLNANSDSIIAYNASTDAPSYPQERDSGSIFSTRRDAIASDLIQAFTRSAIESGQFKFETSPNRQKGRVDRTLLRNLAHLRRSLSQSNHERREAVDKLIGGCLVASYLRDRGILNPEHISSLTGREELGEVFTSGVTTTNRLFEGLTARFNGDVFGSIPPVLPAVEPADLTQIASLLRGDDLLTGHQSLWPYDFSVLPADLVSSVYEELLAPSRKKDSAYYTPRFLVDLLLDEVLPWESEKSSFSPPKLADIACGSGAFMIEAFRRIVYLVQSRLRRRLEYPELTRLLLNNIHGIDHNASAARVAAFGLYLSVLEEVDPPDIWDSVLLPSLVGRNIIVSDAFANHSLRDGQFDLVVSNPPWSSLLTPQASKYVRTSGVPVADQQLAQAFVWLARDMLKPGGQLGLIMPAKGLLHNRSNTAQAFRATLFAELDVTAIVDLSAVRRSVFATAIAPSAVFVARRPGPVNDKASSSADTLLHVAAHPRALGNPVDALIVAPEEIRSVSKRQAASRPDLWKVLLWGSTHDLELIERLRRSTPSLGEIARERGWYWGPGFQVKGDHNDASQLIGLPVVKTESVEFLRSIQQQYELFDQETLHRPRNRRLYSAPLVLIRRGIHAEGIAAVYVERDVVFPHGLIGIAGRDADRAALAALAVTAVSSLGRYWHFMTSASWGVERDFVELNEHLSLPLASPDQKMSSKLFELIDRASLGPDSSLREAVDELVFEMYGLSITDQTRIIDRMRTAIGRFYGENYTISSRLRDFVDYERELQKALNVTLSELSVSTQMYGNGPYRAVAVTFSEDGPSNITTRPEVPVPAVDIDFLVKQISRSAAKSTAVIAQPSGFFVDENTVYLVKTSEPDRWSSDSALDDADRILAALTAGL
ncbi:MAG: SAM-dependent DNA methyltransferase [Pseudonocardiales bacterium]|nr:SAM-dependent DNA methyltransferase [Pseudonocardiales bacterium]